MKNSHIVLFSLLFANSFIIPANPSREKKEEDKGTFDRCFDSPGGFAKCAAVGSIVGLGTGAALWYSWGTAAPMADRIALGISSIFESPRPAPRPAPQAQQVKVDQQIQSASDKLRGGLMKPIVVVRPPSPKREAAPAKQEEKKPDSPRRDDNKKSSWGKYEAPIVAGASFAGGIVVQTVATKGTDDAYDTVTGKKAKRDKEREEDLKMQRESLDIQRQLLAGQVSIHNENRKLHEENRMLHEQAAEQNQKLGVVGGQLRADMGNLSAKIDDVFTGAQQ